MSGEWKTLRVVVEVRVPAKPRIATADLKYQVQMAVERLWDEGIPLPRRREGCYVAKPHFKDFGRLTQSMQKPKANPFEWLVLTGISFIIGSVAHPRRNKDYQSWAAKVAEYFGVATKEVPDEG